MRLHPVPRHAVALAFPLALLGTITPAAAAEPATAPAPAVVETSRCTLDAPDPVPGHLCTDPRLGPWPLPGEPVDALLDGYEPLGDMTDAEFLGQYRDADDRWRYPAHDGFDVTGRGDDLVVHRRETELASAALVDRFGAPTGRFLAPAGTPFEERALPPDTLNDAPDDYHC